MKAESFGRQHSQRHMVTSMADLQHHHRHSLPPQDFQSWDICHVFREANAASDWIANVGHLVDGHFSVVDCTSSALHPILVTAKVGAPLVRSVS